MTQFKGQAGRRPRRESAWWLGVAAAREPEGRNEEEASRSQGLSQEAVVGASPEHRAQGVGQRAPIQHQVSPTRCP